MAKVPAPHTSDPDDDDSEPAALTRELILACALDIIDRDGIDGLTMRRLGKALDRDPMTLYRHAPNKAALLDGIAEMVLEQLVGRHRRR